ncbi:MAG: hypothetical protein RLZZ214_1195 [Verrucomicrobiota bacterium]|jgi:hypothetical protein
MAVPRPKRVVLARLNGVGELHWGGYSRKSWNPTHPQLLIYLIFPQLQPCLAIR